MIKRLAWAVLLMVAVIQVIPAPYRIELREAAPDKSIREDDSVPEAVKAVLRRSCMDCHSEQTRIPWYGRVAPVSWMLARDVENGRAAMNLSRWGEMKSPARVLLSRLACANAGSGRMPPASYLMMHPEAKLSGDEVNVLCQWSAELMKSSRLPRNR
jgi:hypothetical protein